MIGHSQSEGLRAGRGIRYWLSNYIGAGGAGTWGYEGFVGNLATWVLWLRRGHLPPSSLLHLPQASYYQNLSKQHNRIFPFLGLLRFFHPQILDPQNSKACIPPSSHSKTQVKCLLSLCYLSCQIPPSLGIFFEGFLLPFAHVLQLHSIWGHVRIVLVLPDEGSL